MSQWLHYYKTKAWLFRRSQQLQEEPLCRMCKEDGKLTPATVADHVVPHHGDYNLFVLGKLQSLCAFHHNSTKKYYEARGYSMQVDACGWPIDPAHPANSGVVADPLEEDKKSKQTVNLIH
jgi:5-methylcytosine-specific restriction protein A